MSSNNIAINININGTSYYYTALEIAILMCTPSLEMCVIQLTVNLTLAIENNLLDTSTYIVN